MYTRLLWCYPEGLQQAEELSREELCGAQQEEVPNLAPGEEQSHAPVQTGGWPAGKQLCREGPGNQQADHGPAMHHCGKRQQPPGLHWEESCPQVKGRDLSLLLSMD